MKRVSKRWVTEREGVERVRERENECRKDIETLRKWEKERDKEMGKERESEREIERVRNRERVRERIRERER